MAAHADSNSSEKFLSIVTKENEFNFYGSDVGENSEASMDVKTCPYRFEQHRICHNMEPESINEEKTKTETNRLGNADWYLFLFSFHQYFIYI